MLEVPWRLVYLATIPLKVVFALSNSYIHPDEHFQNFEVLTNKILNYNTIVPWEFSQEAASRSFAPLYLFYSPMLYLIKFLGIDLSPIQIWYIIRLQFAIIGTLICDSCLWYLLPNKPERIKALFFTLTSYITLVFQSHCFSNTIETWLVLLSLVILDDLRQITELKEIRLRSRKNHFFFGVLLSIGIFNRITFPAFIIFPSYFLLVNLWSNMFDAVWCVLGFLSVSYIFVLIDTVSYGIKLTSVILNPFSFQSYILTPLNNFIYNSKIENLSTHGLHPRYQHVLINVPQILGPGLFLLFYRFRNRYWKTIPFLSALGGCLSLSIFPHQELRFLMPILPLLCSCFDLRSFQSDSNESDIKSSSIFKFILNAWYVFNIILAILMGTYHQGGVIPALDYFHQSLIKLHEVKTAQIWWRTYSPPAWILGDLYNTVEVKSLSNLSFDSVLSENQKNELIDGMGMEKGLLLKLISNSRKAGFRRVFLVTPTSSFNLELKHQLNANEIWHYAYHLDLDHINIAIAETFKPGLSIYELL
ncbi:uncharacterized protein PRCAT00001121001 [Priceomyces carsonii]|uniref:uncharacterized protein n=1 Tax=Priceomyces carsonii TaxID=28549 RepID=UPI002ED975F1|nr:unnamed protein product [Priceomyces carsonii]